MFVPSGLDNSQLMVEAAMEGLGIAYVPEPYARAALRAFIDTIRELRDRAEDVSLSRRRRAGRAK